MLLEESNCSRSIHAVISNVYRECSSERRNIQCTAAVWRKTPCWCHGSEVRMGRPDGDRRIENRKSLNHWTKPAGLHFSRHAMFHFIWAAISKVWRGQCVFCVLQDCVTVCVTVCFNILITQKAISWAQNCTETSNFRDHSATQELSSLIPT